MGKNDNAIRVTVRFRPMNRREKLEELNTTCVQVSSCARACQLTNVQRPENPHTFGFDRVYTPGVSQGDVYRYTGKPLVDAMKEGYNSTIFAYGQTGSGKTFSMVGVLGTELRGIQPRIIEDTFDYIENLPEEEAMNKFEVQISMCEIYMERIKDLLNPVNENLKVRQDQERGMYVDGIVEQYCASAQEVLDTMDTGFLNRATSATKMNPESSRSHCVTILKVTKIAPNGSRTISKIKMVDLAGSERTSKTEATGQRLQEAMAINGSLTALSKVLNALVEGSSFIPFRDSKLTMLLKDALGGNSRTSLICAASPCTFNLDETISTLRFGTRAKAIKCNAVINKEMSLGDYKKTVKKLEKEVEGLTYENKLLKLKTDCVSDFLSGKGFDYSQIVKDVKIATDDGDDEPDMSGMSFDKVSAQVYEVDKRSGRTVGGGAFTVSLDVNDNDRAATKAQQAEENARIAGIVNALILKGDYKGVAEILKPKVGAFGGVSSEAAMSFEDQIGDLRAELAGADSLCEQFEDELEHQEIRNEKLLQQLSNMEAKLAEHRFYKQKVEFLEREQKVLMKTIKSNPIMDDVTDVTVDIEEFLMDAPHGAEDYIRSKVGPLLKSMTKKDGLIKKLRGNAGMGIEDVLAKLNLNGDKGAAVKKILELQQASVARVAEQDKKIEDCKRAISMQVRREKHYQELQANWKNQLKQMEKAVLACGAINKRDAAKFTAQLEAKDEQIMKLKDYLAKVNQLRAEQMKKTNMPRAVRTPSPLMRKKRMTKKRPARASGEQRRAVPAL